MERALALAARARGRTAPNPMVGAVVVRDGALLAEGWHRGPGLAHAEVDALERIGGRAPGATMYVNLEPCCHHGRTPPCTDALLLSGIRRVVVGMVDPDPRVAGQGIAILRAAGLEVEVGIALAECEALNAAYLCASRRGRPLVTLKAGLTLDGRIASANGESCWITGEAARLAGHRLRDVHDAILVGRGTLLADDPALTTRFEGGRDPLPVLLDSSRSMPADARVLQGSRRPLLFHAPEASGPTPACVDLVAVPRAQSGGLSLPDVLSALRERGVHSVLVEGGGQVHRSFIDAGLVDRIELFISMKVLAGGPGWVGGAPIALAEAPRFRLLSAHPLGEDLHLSLEAPPGAP